MREQIFLSPPDVGVREKELLVRAVESGWVAPVGPDLDLFEAAAAEVCGRKFGVAVSSGTAALHLALLAAGVKSGEYVVTATMTFVATANAISYIGAVPVFVDSDPETGNMSPSLLENALHELSRRGEQVGAVVPVDLLGKPAAYMEIMKICSDWEVPVVSDAAESLGSRYCGEPAGSFGLLAAVSFNGNKIATTSGGGMVLTDQQELADRVRHLATQARVPARHYEHQEVGFNYRLSNLLAAVGRAQIERLPLMVLARKRIRNRYRTIVSQLPDIEVFGGDASEDNCWLSAIVVSADAGWRPEELGKYLDENNIESRPLWKPMHLQPAYHACEAFLDGTSEDLYRRGLVLPSGSGMSEEELSRIESALREFVYGNDGSQGRRR